jgi:hypothetical protein
MNTKDRRDWFALAKRNGAVIVNGKKHYKVYAADGRYLVSIQHGSNNRSTSPQDEAYRIARREGWT